MEQLDLTKFVVQDAPPTGAATYKNKKAKSEVKTFYNKKFLSGPIPMDWLMKACQLNASAINIGLYLWYLRGCTKNKTVKLSNKAAAEVGVGRTTKYAALKELENAGLVSVDRTRGKALIVTILEIE